MPKVSIYLPDDLYQDARAHELPLSALAQQAIENALTATRTTAWVDRVRSRPPRHHGDVDSAALVDAVRDEFGQ
jgi:post-segregation antitoxin (ccd killing protein)